MAKRKVRFNPAETKQLRRDVQAVVTRSTAAIDAVYERYVNKAAELKSAEGLLEDIKREPEPETEAGKRRRKEVIRAAKARISLIRRELKDIDRDIANYGRDRLKGFNERLTVAKTGPMASMQRKQISEVNRAIFRLENKLRRGGADVRKDIANIEGMMVTLEQDVGLTLGEGRDILAGYPRELGGPRRKTRAEQLREDVATIIRQWENLYPHVKDRKEFRDDVLFVRAQLRAAQKETDPATISGHLARIKQRIDHMKRFAKVREKLMVYDQASALVAAFALKVEGKRLEGVTAAEVDRLKRELEGIRGSISAQAKATWPKANQRAFASEVRAVSKTLDGMKRGKRRATRNPKKNRGRPPKLPATGTLPAAAKRMYKTIFDAAYKYYRAERKATKEKAEEIAARTAWDEVERYYYKRGDRWLKRKTPKPQVDRPHDVKLPTKPKRKRTQKVKARKNPLKKVPSTATQAQVRKAVSENISMLMAEGYPQKQATAAALSQARRDAPGPAEALYGPAPNPKRKAKKKRTKRKAAQRPEAERLIRMCQKRWEHYCARPGKKRLKDVFEHLEKMKASKNKKVVEERKRCLRAANAEAKRLKMK